MSPPPRNGPAAAAARAARELRSKPDPLGADLNVGAEPPFWKRKTLDELTPSEWESLCDGCGRCCLVKLEDEDCGKIHFTNIACRLFDPVTCRCSDYAHRHRKVHDCIRLTPAKVRELGWLPPSCAYRLVSEERDLPWWHPLVSGSESTVHEAGVSVRGRIAGSERDVKLADWPDHIVAWPAKRPRVHMPKTSASTGSAQGPPAESGENLENSLRPDCEPGRRPFPHPRKPG